MWRSRSQSESISAYGVVRLFDIDEVSDRDPTRAPGDPENFRTVVLRIEIVTAKRAHVIDDCVNLQAGVDQPSINGAEVVETCHSQ